MSHDMQPSKRRKTEKCLQKLTAAPHLEFCAVRLTQDDIVRLGLLTEDDRINTQVERNTALILAIADDSWVTAGRQPRMPDAAHVQHYDCNRNETIGCAVFWNTRVCHCKEFDYQNNTVIFKLQKAGMRDREGFLHVAVMRQDGIDANDAADRAAPWRNVKHPACAFILGPTRNMLYARTTEEPSAFAHLRKFSRQTKTETQITRDTQTQTLTITAALDTDMCTNSAAYLRAYSEGASTLSVALEPVPRDVLNTHPERPKLLQSVSSPSRDEPASQEWLRRRYLDDMTALNLGITAERHPTTVTRQVGMPALQQYAREATLNIAGRLGMDAAAKISEMTDRIFFDRWGNYKEVGHLFEDWEQKSPRTRREVFRAQLLHGNIPSEKSAHWKRTDPLRGLDASNAQQKMNDLASWIEGFAKESL